MPTSDPLILGLNSAYHESSAAIVRGSRVLFAVEEERLTRVKRGKSAQIDNPDALPWMAIDECLKAAKIELGDLDAVAYGFTPGCRQRTLGVDSTPLDDEGGFGTEEGEAEFDRRVRSVPELLAARAGVGDFATKVFYVPHHRAHAASAFYASPFPSAAVLVLDGIGEHATGWLGVGDGQALRQIGEIPYPHSIGLLWERISRWLGFSIYDAGKVMGLAAYGDASACSSFDELFGLREGHAADTLEAEPPFFVDLEYAQFRSGDVRGLEQLFGPRREKTDDPTEPRFANVAAALQRRTTEAVLAVANQLHRATNIDSLVYAGGVALNCVTNERVEALSPFERIYVAGAAHDAGTALGAALDLAHRRFGVPRLLGERALSPYLGPEYGRDACVRALERRGLRYESVERPHELAASSIAAGKIVGWFDGRVEFGPRALGMRSLLADPRDLATRTLLNSRIKHREPFRPFAASILEEHADEYLVLPQDRPGGRDARELMILAYPVRTEKRAIIPAAVHVDGTCRVQMVSRDRAPRYHMLIEAFHAITGVPAVLNTSFNDQEPIVCSPDDAVETFLGTNIDLLIFGAGLVVHSTT